VEERDDAYVVELELPGVRESDVEVSLAGRRLIVSGERREKERVGLLRRRTRRVGRFYYEVELPGAVDEDGVTASLDEGVLTVMLPKAERAGPPDDQGDASRIDPIADTVELLARRVLEALRHHVTEGEWEDIRSSMPRELAGVLP
jgi:hypothetical protein